MAKKMLIDATHPEETRVVVVDGTKVEEFDFESLSKRQLAGNIYLAKVTRVEPSLQAAFVDYGGNRHGFLAFSEIHPDYYQIPVADREALLAEEREYAEAMAAEAEEEAKPKRRRSRRRKPNGTKAEATETDAVTRGTPSGMDVVDLDEPEDDDTAEAAQTPEASDAAEAAEDSPAAEAEADTPETGDGRDRCRRRG
jgi:ribonuclease E